MGGTRQSTAQTALDHIADAFTSLMKDVSHVFYGIFTASDHAHRCSNTNLGRLFGHAGPRKPREYAKRFADGRGAGVTRAPITSEGYLTPPIAARTQSRIAKGTE